MLTNDMDKLVSNTLSGNELLNKRHDEEIKRLKANEDELNFKIKKIMEEKAELLKQIENLNSNYRIGYDIYYLLIDQYLLKLIIYI